jgi:hypothetical protein
VSDGKDGDGATEVCGVVEVGTDSAPSQAVTTSITAIKPPTRRNVIISRQIICSFDLLSDDTYALRMTTPYYPNTTLIDGANTAH